MPAGSGCEVNWVPAAAVTPRVYQDELEPVGDVLLGSNIRSLARFSWVEAGTTTAVTGRHPVSRPDYDETTGIPPRSNDAAGSAQVIEPAGVWMLVKPTQP